MRSTTLWTAILSLPLTVVRFTESRSVSRSVTSSRVVIARRVSIDYETRTKRYCTCNYQLFHRNNFNKYY